MIPSGDILSGTELRRKLLFDPIIGVPVKEVVILQQMIKDGVVSKHNGDKLFAILCEKTLERNFKLLKMLADGKVIKLRIKPKGN